MNTAFVAGAMCQTITIVLAFALARRRSQHKAFAIFAAAVFAQDMIRHVLNAGPLNALRPYSGVLRIVFHADQALFLLEPIGLVVIAWIVFLGKRPWIPLAAGTAAWLTLVVGYPSPFRGAPLGYAYALIQAISLIACVTTMILWTRRKAPPRPEHAAVSLSALLSFALFAGPYMPPLPRPFDTWKSAELIFLCIWAALAVVHAAALWAGFAMPKEK